MTMQTVLVTSQTRPGVMAIPMKALNSLLAAWKEHRRRKADLALLMSLDPHILSDIGVKLVRTPYDGGSIVSLNPAVLAATMLPRIGNR